MPAAPGTDGVSVAAQQSPTSSRPATSPPPRVWPLARRRSSSPRSSCTLLSFFPLFCPAISFIFLSFFILFYFTLFCLFLSFFLSFFFISFHFVVQSRRVSLKRVSSRQKKTCRGVEEYSLTSRNVFSSLAQKVMVADY